MPEVTSKPGMQKTLDSEKAERRATRNASKGPAAAAAGTAAVVVVVTVIVSSWGGGGSSSRSSSSRSSRSRINSSRSSSSGSRTSRILRWLLKIQHNLRYLIPREFLGILVL